MDIPKFKVCVVGDINVGKTCMMTRLRTGCFSNMHSTIGAELQIQRVQYAGKMYTLSVWDTAGSEKFRSVIRTYYRNAVAAFIVYDVTERKTFDSVEYWWETLQGNESGITTIVLCGNKADLTEMRQVSASEGSQLAEKLRLTGFFETSALTGENLEEAIMEIVKSVHEKNNGGQIWEQPQNTINLEDAVISKKGAHRECAC